MKEKGYPNMRRCNSTNNTTHTVRLVVLGDNNVGKTALVVRFLTKRFIGEYDSEAEATYEHELPGTGGNIVTAEICDSLTSKNPINVLKKYSTKTDVYMVVYSVCSRDSFQYACSLANHIRSSNLKSTSANEVAPVVMIGNKTDLDHCREVTTWEGEEMANTLSSCHFTETSAAESYQQTEKAFRLAFSVITFQSEQSAPTTFKWRRKKSFTHVANMIRDHVRKTSSVSSDSAPDTSSGQLVRWNSFSDRNNNSNSSFDGRKRTRRTATSALRANSYLHSADHKRPSKCVSLETLCEKPDAEHDPSVPASRCSPSSDKVCLHKHDKFNTAASARSPSSHSERCCKSHGDNPNCSWPPSDGLRMSVGTDDTIDLSDFSTAEDDPFSSNFESSLSSAPSITDFKEESAAANVLSGNNSKLPAVRKTSLNKKGLQITIHSDREGDNGDSSHETQTPPKSAPVLASATKFRFFPNGISAAREQSSATWSNFSRANAPVSPLLSGRRQNSFRSSKEDSKRSPPGNLLKQFFKGSFAALNMRSSANPSSMASTPSLNNCPRSCNTSSASLTDDCELDSGTSRMPCACPQPVVGKDHKAGSEHFSSSAISASAPSSTRCPQHSVSTIKRERPRRSSFREAVGDLIKKRKSSCSSDYMQPKGKVC